MVEKNNPKPFLKWVGSKRSLIPEVLRRTPSWFNNYYEPFAGSGTVFFNLQPIKATLSDVNLPLMVTYNVVQKQPRQLIDLLRVHARNHCSEYFYQVRKQFCSPIENLDSDRALSIASQMIYLNKTCYNGLYRTNKKGEFNVGFGSYKNPEIVNEHNVLACSQALRNATFRCGGFHKITPEEGDFVYADPPYHNSYNDYTNYGFGDRDQEKLAAWLKGLDNIGVKFLLSNSDTEFIRELYSSFKLECVLARRSVSCKADGRSAIAEVLIRNY